MGDGDMVYEGEERREHCENHEDNTREIAGMKSKLNMIIWLLGILIGANGIMLFKTADIYISLSNNHSELERMVAVNTKRLEILEVNYTALDKRVDQTEYYQRGIPSFRSSREN
jgi:hypothetical protein